MLDKCNREWVQMQPSFSESATAIWETNMVDLQYLR